MVEVNFERLTGIESWALRSVLYGLNQYRDRFNLVSEQAKGMKHAEHWLMIIKREFPNFSEAGKEEARKVLDYANTFGEIEYGMCVTPKYW